MWTVLVYVVCAVQICSAQVPWFVDSYERSPCVTPSGSSGVCKQRNDCLVTLPNPTPVSEDENGRALCGSLGPSALVCCDSRASEVTTPGVMSTAEVVTESTHVTEPPRARVGETSAKYCLSIISFNRQPWWVNNGFMPEENELAPWWEETEEDVTQKQDGFALNGAMKKTIREFPHMALLGYLAPGQQDITWGCTGTLISNRFVLTATHCFADRTLRAPIVVRLGEFDLASNDRTEQDFGIAATWFHPRDKPGTWYHDLALIKLDREVKFNRVISPACLSKSPEGAEREEGLIVTGWGSSASADNPRQVLLKSSGPLSVVSRNECASYYRSARRMLPNGIHPGMVCAVNPVGDSDTCQGDSGGPIQLPTAFDVYVVVGVSTPSVRHCGGGIPSIYTRVSYYLDWIENIVWPNGV